MAIEFFQFAPHVGLSKTSPGTGQFHQIANSLHGVTLSHCFIFPGVAAAIASWGGGPPHPSGASKDSHMKRQQKCCVVASPPILPLPVNLCQICTHLFQVDQACSRISRYNDSVFILNLRVSLLVISHGFHSTSDTFAFSEFLISLDACGEVRRWCLV